MQIAIREKQSDKRNLATGLGNVADDQLKIGALRETEGNLRRSIDLCRDIEDTYGEGIGHAELCRMLSYVERFDESEKEFLKATELFGKTKHIQYMGVAWSYRALRFLLLARESALFDIRNSKIEYRITNPEYLNSSIESAKRALELADETAKPDSGFVYPIRDYIRAYWLLGAACRANNELYKAEENLSKAISMCRQINVVADEADILLELARLSFDYALQQAQGSAQDERYLKDAKEKSEEALTITERCGYVLQGADVNLFLAELAVKGYKLDSEKGMSDKEAALFYAKRAKNLATCDGPPYYYKVAFEEAERLLEKLK
jgi:hypothetical protein